MSAVLSSSTPGVYELPDDPSHRTVTLNSRIGAYNLDAPNYNPKAQDKWTDAHCIVMDPNRVCGVQKPEKSCVKAVKLDGDLGDAITEGGSIYDRLDALQKENERLERENAEFRQANNEIREVLPQMPYIGMPPAQLALSSFWDARGAHPVEYPNGELIAPGFPADKAELPDTQVQPGPGATIVAKHLNDMHQEYLHSRQSIIDEREAEYQKLQEQLKELDQIKPDPVQIVKRAKEEPVYSERNHARLEFGKFDKYHRTYSEQWKHRPERAAAGHRYVGDWVDGKEHGRGIYTYADGKYCGEWQAGKPHGHGIFQYSNGDVHQGMWEDGKKCGEGSYTYAKHGNVYSGQWKGDKRNGHGVYCTAQGASYEGQWKDGCQHGEGIVKYEDGSVYEGAWHMDHEHGSGRHTSPSGEVYEGQWKESLKHGQGTLHFVDGTCYHGIWMEGQDTHEGHFANSDGTELGSNLVKERPMPTPAHSSAVNAQYQLTLPYRFSDCKMSGDYGGAGWLKGRRGVPCTMRR